MSDFDDDETTEAAGAKPSAGDGDAPAADQRGAARAEDVPGQTARRRPRPADDDDWDDEPVARRRRAPADDEWDDDWDDDAGPGGRRDLTLIFAIIAAVAVIALVVVLTRPTKSSNTPSTNGTAPSGQISDSSTTGKGFCADWPGVVGGNGSAVSKGTGLFIWSDFNGWHVRSNRKDTVSVQVSAPSNITVKAKGNATSSADAGKLVTLTLPGGGDGSKGPDLDIPCDATSATFQVSANGTTVPAGDVKVGDTGTASNNPVTYTRGQP